MNAVKGFGSKYRGSDVLKVFNLKIFIQNKCFNERNKKIKGKGSFSSEKNFINIRKKLFNVFFSEEENIKNNNSFISNKLLIKSLSENKIFVNCNCSKNIKYIYIKDFIKTGKILNEIMKIKQKFVNNINQFHEI